MAPDGTKQDFSEQRMHTRVAINDEFECIEEFVAEYVTNISEGGIFIRSKNPLKVGTKVSLKFSVILDDIEVIEGEGEVVRVDTGPNSGMGVVFTRLTGSSKRLVDRICARAESQQENA